MLARKNIAILGSTGSIGRNALEVIGAFPDRFRVTYLTANSNIDLLLEQVERFHPVGIVFLDEACAQEAGRRLKQPVEVLAGERGLEEVVTRDDVDVVISSLVGFAGL